MAHEFVTDASAWKKLHVGFVNTLYPPYGASGAETTLRLLAGALVARGHRCTVISLTPGRQAESRAVDGVSAHYLPLANVYWPHGGARPRALRPVFQALDAYNPVMERRLGRLLDALQPQVVNAHNLQGFSVSAWRAAHRRGIPLVQTLHDYYAACPRSAMWRPGRGNCARPCAECHLFAAPRRRFSTLPAAVTCVSHRVFDRIAASGTFGGARDGRPPVRIIRGNNPADELPPLPPPRGGGPWRFGFMGRLDPSKGVEELIDAMAGLDPAAARLAIAGRGEPQYEQALRARAARSHGVHFLGHVAPDTFFRALDTLVIPSVWEDPFPRVFHEALSYGVPTLVTPLGGIPEAIAPGRTGWIADGASPDLLRAAMRRVMSGEHDQAAMCEACRQAARLYAPDRIVSHYEAVLTAAAAGAALPADAGESWRGGDVRR